MVRPARSGRLVTATRVILVSDSHLSPDAPEAQANWAAVVRHVATARPDLVIHLGDLSLDGMRNPAELDHARRQLDLLPAQWQVIPGNHDVSTLPICLQQLDIVTVLLRKY